MPIEKHCEQYLDSHEVIRILQSNNETFISRVLECIRACRDMICNGIVTTHYLIDEEILYMCCEDAFQNAQMAFVQQVQNNRFHAQRDNCIPFIKVIFRRLYYHEYKKELKRKLQSQQLQPEAGKTANEDAWDDTKEKVTKIVAQLNENDQQIYRLYYEEGRSTKEITETLGIAPDSVTKQVRRLHRRFAERWQQL